MSKTTKTTTKNETTGTRADVYTRVTDRIVADLERGVRTWLKPWSADHASDRLAALPMRHNGTPYRGVNVLLLWGEAMEKGYTLTRWMTYKQAEALGAHVRKGERGALVVYADTFSKTEEYDKGEEVERSVPFMKGLYRLQCRADRRPARAVLHPRRAPRRGPHAGAGRDGRSVLREHRRDLPPWWQPRLRCAER